MNKQSRQERIDDESQVKQEDSKEKPMNRRSLRQYSVWAGVAIVMLIGVGLITYLIAIISNGGSKPPAPTNTPPPTPTRIVVTIMGIKSQAKLSTVKYNTVAEIYKENVPAGWLDSTLGRKEKLLMLVYGDVQAGFDLEKLKEENLWTDGTRVRLVLPAPEILSSSIDFDHTHIVYYENNLILENNNPNLQGEALAEAQKALEQAALQQGILDKANDYGKLYYENFLRSLGFTEVEVVTNAQVFDE
jgi:hypothetical protein